MVLHTIIGLSLNATENFTKFTQFSFLRKQIWKTISPAMHQGGIFPLLASLKILINFSSNFRDYVNLSKGNTTTQLFYL